MDDVSKSWDRSIVIYISIQSFEMIDYQRCEISVNFKIYDNADLVIVKKKRIKQNSIL